MRNLSSSHGRRSWGHVSQTPEVVIWSGAAGVVLVSGGRNRMTPMEMADRGPIQRSPAGFTVTNLPLNSARAAFWSSTVRDEPVIALALGVRAG
jgi:hypothetical protein